MMTHDLNTLSAYDFTLPEELIARTPARPRHSARLAVCTPDSSVSQPSEHARITTTHTYADLPDLLKSGDLLIFNNTRVIPARLHGTRPPRPQFIPAGTPAVSSVDQHPVAVELLLHHPLPNKPLTHWSAFARPLKRLKEGDIITFTLPASPVEATSQAAAASLFQAKVTARTEEHLHLQFLCAEDELYPLLERYGTTPLPPYIPRTEADGTPATASQQAQDKQDYQTVFAAHNGSVAAPTASLHFSEELLAALAAKGIQHAFVTLHVGAGTFQPVRAEHLDHHIMHAEWGSVPPETVTAIRETKARGSAVIPVGTTALRLVETAARHASDDDILKPYEGWTDIFIRPGFRFKVADRLLTNFHLPCSTLLVLVAAFVGYEHMKALYEKAIADQMRFYSFGDGCLLTRQKA